jgi:hypothetical protein
MAEIVHGRLRTPIAGEYLDVAEAPRSSVHVSISMRCLTQSLQIIWIKYSFHSMNLCTRDFLDYLDSNLPRGELVDENGNNGMTNSLIPKPCSVYGGIVTIKSRSDTRKHDLA